MKKHKLFKMLAMVMVLVMMLSTSVFAAGNDGVEVTSVANYQYDSGVVRDTFTVAYVPSDQVTRYITFTVTGTYGIYISTSMSNSYFDYVSFGEVTNATVDGTTVALTRTGSYGSDDTCWYRDYQINYGSNMIRVYVTCNELGDVEMSATEAPK